MAADDIQVGGEHYKAGYQHWSLVADTGMGYFEGQISKYLSRHNKKNGLQDVEKSGHFALKLLELRKEPSWGDSMLGQLHEDRRRRVYLNDKAQKEIAFALGLYFRDNQHIGGLENQAISLCANWRSPGDLVVIQSMIVEVAHRYEEGAATRAYVAQGEK